MARESLFRDPSDHPHVVALIANDHRSPIDRGDGLGRDPQGLGDDCAQSVYPFLEQRYSWSTQVAGQSLARCLAPILMSIRSIRKARYRVKIVFLRGPPRREGASMYCALATFTCEMLCHSAGTPSRSAKFDAVGMTRVSRSPAESYSALNSSTVRSLLPKRTSICKS